MKHVSSPLLVVVALAALAVGSLGTAVAGPALTKAKVKVIAGQVVKKQAPTLAVASATNAAHATTAASAASAGNAANLDGRPPSAYETRSYRYRLPVQAGADMRIYSFPGLPPGTYQFTYYVAALTTAAGMFCSLRPTAANANGEGYQIATFDSVTFAAVSAAGIVETDGSATLGCGGPAANFSIAFSADTRSSVTFTRVDGLTEGVATAP